MKEKMYSLKFFADAGSRGGSKTSPKKIKACKASLKKARLARWGKK